MARKEDPTGDENMKPQMNASIRESLDHTEKQNADTIMNLGRSHLHRSRRPRQRNHPASASLSGSAVRTRTDLWTEIRTLHEHGTPICQAPTSPAIVQQYNCTKSASAIASRTAHSAPANLGAASSHQNRLSDKGSLQRSHDRPLQYHPS